MANRGGDIEGQLSIFDFIEKPKPKNEYLLPCDTCGHDVKGCCDYDYIANHDYCVLGDKWIPKQGEPFMNEPEEPKEEIKDDYIREHPSCFYVFGYYLDKAAGWHKVPEELPTFSVWTKVDVVLFGQKTGTSWMELEKWEAKDWTFRSIDQRRDTETTEVMAWKVSDRVYEAGEWIEDHGQRVMFEDLKVNHYYVTDYSTSSHKWLKVVYVKWIKDDSVGYVDAPKGVKGEWIWGNNYSALSRKAWINAEREIQAGEADTNGWFYEIPEGGTNE